MLPRLVRAARRPAAAASLLAALAAGCAPAAPPATTPAPQPGGAPGAAMPAAGQPPAGGAAAGGGAGGGAAAARRPRPYAQVVTRQAVTDTGGITVHKADDRWLLELPDSLLRRDFLLVSRVAAVPTNFPGFLSAGSSIEERLVRWERNADRLLLRSLSAGAYAPDSLPIALSVASNNFGPILAAFPVAAYGRDSASFVLDVTDFFGGDTPALSGLSAEQRRQYQVRRFDPARSYVSSVKSFPLNVEVRHTQTFDAGAPPSDPGGATVSIEMRQSIVLLPKEPMRPRYADSRIGFFSVSRVNYGLDAQKAAEQTFIRRWRLEPKDPAAYARGELVEPVKSITYYLDPATPAKWRPYVRRGVEDWQRVFEKAGFRNAIVAKEPPSSREDPDWDPEDIRYSVVRWTANLTRNAVGPSTSDPRTGEIIESDITWYHNHMRSYRNRLLIETGAANPAARSLELPEALMGETMRQVIAHEIGHALGLPHNMIASSSFPVDSLRAPSFTRRYGVSATIMDYARQNYVAQPGDGLEPGDFVRRLGPWDEFVINWGYRVLPDAPTPEAERPILNSWYVGQTGPMPYRYLQQYFSGVDPRAQTEDLGDDPIRASGFAVANLKRVVPNLVAWTTRPGEDYTDLQELYGETLGMWGQYMGHVVNLVGGVTIETKTAEQAGAVFRPVPRARQEAALRFLEEHVVRTPSWLAPSELVSRIGPAPLAARQAAVLTNLMTTARLGRMAEAEAMDPAAAYPLAEYMTDLRRMVWGTPGSGAAPDANRRALQRVHLDRLATIVAPPPPPTGGAPGAGGGGGGGPQTPPSPLLAPTNVPRSDLPALARSQLRAIRADALRAAGSTTGLSRAHWQDVADRIEAVLEPR